MNHVVLVLDTSLLDFVIQKGLSLDELAIITLLGRGEMGLLEIYCRRGYTVDQKRVLLQSLIRKQLVIVKTESDLFKVTDYELTELGRELLEQGDRKIDILEVVTGVKEDVVTPLEELTLNYLELFPKGIRNGGNKPLRSNTTDVKAKLMKFIAKYKYSPQIILTATAQYLDSLRGSYTYCPTAEYFILKEGSSALASECEKLASGAGDGELINPFEKRM
jgi:DNA-binding MarR family transcriptional regulator